MIKINALLPTAYKLFSNIIKKQIKSHLEEETTEE
jgi:hypothetical protein